MSVGRHYSRAVGPPAIRRCGPAWGGLSSPRPVRADRIGPTRCRAVRCGRLCRYCLVQVEIESLSGPGGHGQRLRRPVGDSVELPVAARPGGPIAPLHQAVSGQRPGRSGKSRQGHRRSIRGDEFVISDGRWRETSYTDSPAIADRKPNRSNILRS